MELNLEEALRYAGVPSSPPEELRREMAGLAAQMTRSVTPGGGGGCSSWSTRRRGRTCRS